MSGTTCYMHSHELVVVHALGLRTRSRNKVITDEFEVGKMLRDKVKILLSLIMNKKCKKRYQNYKRYCMDNLQCETTKFIIPNDTRMSGVCNMFESILRSKKCLSFYTMNSRDAHLYNGYTLRDEEWVAINEFYSILNLTKELTVNCQSDHVDNNCFAYYHVAKVRHTLITAKEFKILNFQESWTPTTDISSSTILIDIKRENMLQTTQTLIARLVNEYNLYFKALDSDQIMMMILHPIMVWKGFWYVYGPIFGNWFI